MRYIIFLFLWCFASPAFSQKPAEDFDNFSYHFFSDSTFQLKRISFPLVKISLNSDYTLQDTILVTSEHWKFSDFGFWRNSYNVQVYDNFRRILRSTNERVISFEGVENGISDHLYFRLISGKWFLVRIENTST